jgi:hypothetical protein
MRFIKKCFGKEVIYYTFSIETSPQRTRVMKTCSRMILNCIKPVLLITALGSALLAQPISDPSSSRQPDSVGKPDTSLDNIVTGISNTTPESTENQPDHALLSKDDTPSLRPLSLFDYGQIISIGLNVHYFDYKEEPDLNEDIQSFTEHFKHKPDTIIGAPKSTEYGTVVGLNAGASLYSWKSRMLFRPKAELLFGFNTTYDGSTQSQLVTSGKDTIGLAFDPIKHSKNNLFFHAGCDIGYAFPFFRFPFVIYSGLDYKLWYRDLLDYNGQWYFSFGVNYSETYSWFNVPLGVLLTLPLSPDREIGLDARLDWMLYGSMSVVMNAGTDGSAVDYPAVTLGNHAAFRLELFSLKKTNDHMATKFAPYVVFYGFGKSNTETATSSSQSYSQSFYEPASRTYQVGANFSLEFLNKGVTSRN